MNAVETREAVEVSFNPRPIWGLAIRWAIGTGIGVVLVTAAYLLVTNIAGPLVVASAGEVTLGNVIGFTVFGGTVGAATAYVIGRVARRPRLTFLTVALIALAGYAVVPFNAAESLETATWLNVFHVVVAIPAIGMLTRYLPKDRTSAEA
jgi:hypothetical protein